jgi:hypothetical protein
VSAMQTSRRFDLFGAIPVPLAQSSETDRVELRLESAIGALSAVDVSDGEVLLLFPAGYLRTETQEEQTAVFGAMVEEARGRGVHLIFGSEVVSRYERNALATPMEAAYLYRHDRNALFEFSRIESDHVNSMEAFPRERAFQFGSLKIALLFAGEIFYSSIRRGLANSRPDLTIILAPSGITRRWGPALEALESIAPTLILPRVAVPRKGREPPSPRGWHKELYGATASLLLFRWYPQSGLKQSA